MDWVWDWDWDGLDLCAGLFYEHRFAMLKMASEMQVAPHQATWSTFSGSQNKCFFRLMLPEVSINCHVAISCQKVP